MGRQMQSGMFWLQTHTHMNTREHTFHMCVCHSSCVLLGGGRTIFFFPVMTSFLREIFFKEGKNKTKTNQRPTSLGSRDFKAALQVGTLDEGVHRLTGCTDVCKHKEDCVWHGAQAFVCFPTGTSRPCFSACRKRGPVTPGAPPRCTHFTPAFPMCGRWGRKAFFPHGGTVCSAW